MDSSKNAETPDFRPLRPSKRPLRLSFGMMMDRVDPVSATETIRNYGIDGDGRKEKEKEFPRSREIESENESETEAKSTGGSKFFVRPM